MRKLYRTGLVLSCLACCFTTNAWATSVTCIPSSNSATTLSCVYTYEPLDVILSSAGSATSSDSWSWSIASEINQGWEFSDAKVKIFLADDNDHEQEKAELEFNGIEQKNSGSNFNSNAWRNGFSLSIGSFNDELLTVSLTAIDGDFLFQRAQMIVNYNLSTDLNDNMGAAIPVPEAPTMILFGAGLIGLGGFLTRRTRSK